MNHRRLPIETSGWEDIPEDPRDTREVSDEALRDSEGTPGVACEICIIVAEAGSEFPVPAIDIFYFERSGEAAHS